jgi:hypothetical protein
MQSRDNIAQAKSKGSCMNMKGAEAEWHRRH